MTGEHLIDRPAYSTPCTGCHARVIIAITAGLTVCADPQPLTVNQEIAAHLTHRGVYDLLSRPGCKTWLIYRDTTRVLLGNREYPVIGDHQCPAGKPHNNWRIPGQRTTLPRPRDKPACPDTAPVPF